MLLCLDKRTLPCTQHRACKTIIMQPCNIVRTARKRKQVKVCTVCNLPVAHADHVQKGVQPIVDISVPRKTKHRDVKDVMMQ